MIRKPEWLRIRYRKNEETKNIEGILKKLSLHTVCQEAMCPNLFECFSRKTATFMILGKTCTRNCTFCNVKKGSPDPVDLMETERLIQAVKEIDLKYIVITSVTRDDLTDGGAFQFAQVIKSLHRYNADLWIEVLVPDFKGNWGALEKVTQAKPDVLNHNIETIERLYSEVRPMANYDRSLELLKRAGEENPHILTKSGLMVGLGEQKDEVLNVFQDLREAGCSLLTIGQYLSPSKNHHPIVEFVTPETFTLYERKAYEMGFTGVSSGPLVRSSHRAKELFCLSQRPQA